MASEKELALRAAEAAEEINRLLSQYDGNEAQLLDIIIALVAPSWRLVARG